MMNSTKSIDNTTPIDDISGLLLPKNKIYSLEEIYQKEAQNIAEATIKYLASVPTKKEASFAYEWLLLLHKEMFGNVWDWAGKLRKIELSIGIKAYLVPMELKKLSEDIKYWDINKTFDVYETSARLHHRAVQIHPFKNGNGRWSRMLANIYLRQHDKMPIKWQEDLLAKENPKRNEYIEALKKADVGEFTKLIELHRNTY
ncbi:mobile mystery protein B [Campylobacter blaseri]|uniref:Mobile mystery protein B n=2 Tax=Campylobacter blaseri TaxID=2042961 RepID=A0A2P8QZH9_9BACT|nr:mobile mystery protein B [Campylobacter blaseri]PSM51653.1 mobile mystery protein B [Campylobacter blaseri]PSM53446.1 mobile mystery protein B [Campylobacter blaseri]